MGWDRMGQDELEWVGMGWDGMVQNGRTWYRCRWDWMEQRWMGLDGLKKEWYGMGQDRMGFDRIALDGIGWDRIRWIGRGYYGMAWDKVGWDQMGQDGIGFEGIPLDGMGTVRIDLGWNGQLKNLKKHETKMVIKIQALMNQCMEKRNCVLTSLPCLLFLDETALVLTFFRFSYKKKHIELETRESRDSRDSSLKIHRILNAGVINRSI